MLSLSPAQKRLKYMGCIVIAVVFVLASRLWYLQIVKGSVYEALSLGNRVRVIPVTAPRGKILDRSGIPLASNRLAFCVSVVPQDVRDREGTIAWLSQVLEMTPESIEQKLSSPRRPFEPIRIKQDVSPDAVVAIGERRTEFPGVIIEEIPVETTLWVILQVMS